MHWLLLALGVGAALLSRRWTKQADEKRRSVWRKVALARGGLYHEPRGGWRASQEAIEVDIDGARVHLDLVVIGSSENRRVYTRCRAQFALLLGPVFHIAPEGVLATLGKALGGQDVALGVDPAFDGRFVIKCDDVEAVRQVWTLPAMRTMLRCFEKATIRSDGRDVELMVDEGLDVAALIDDALDLVAEIVNADIFGLGALRALPGAVHHPATGPWNDRSAPYVVVEHPVPVTLAPIVLGRRAVTRATVGDGPRARPLKLLVRAHGACEPADGARELPPAATTWLRKVGDGTLIVDGARTSFTWLRIETDPERLLAGVRLLAALAGAPAQGVYR
jgi:hypothetical protein